MRLPRLNLVSMKLKRRRRRHRIQSRKGSIAYRVESGCSPCQKAEPSMGGQMNEHPGPNLPEDIWCQIHSLVPMRDAARVACVSRAFAQSWRYHSNLVFSEETLGINLNSCRKDEKLRDFTRKVDCILKKHSGIGIKTVRFHVAQWGRLYHLDSWLHIAVKPGIEELNLDLSSTYDVPCLLLSGGVGDSLRYLALASCQFRPTKFVFLKSLRRLHLSNVEISEDELECLLSNSFSLEQLKLRSCNEIVCLKIPCLQQLNSLEVFTCHGLQAIENKSPNLSSLSVVGNCHVQVQLLLGRKLPVKKLWLSHGITLFYARTEFPYSLPDLEDVTISSYTEVVDTPMVNSKFHHLKVLKINLGGHGYDFLSLVSFFDASPSLETFRLTVISPREGYLSIFANPLDMRMIPEHRHDKLKNVEITNFSSAKSLIELTFHIVQSSRSLERLTLDTTQGFLTCSVNKIDRCLSMPNDVLIEARRALLAFQTYIKPNVPPTVELNFAEPCSRCHAEFFTLSEL